VLLDLFDTPVISGFASSPDFLGVGQERELIARIDAVDLAPFRFQQWIGKRLTHSFGWNYDFQSGALSRGEPFPDWLLPIRDWAAAKAGVTADALVQALLIRYDEGAAIGWHKDRPIYEHVLGISLGTPAEMRFRRRAGQRWERATAPLAPRSIYHLAGEVRRDWEHSIVAMSHTRYSVTLRSFSEMGRRTAAHVAMAG
jgi:DNA oxidative demethylase